MLAFGHYEERVRDLTPRRETMAPGTTPFESPYVYRNQSLMFNIANLGHTLLADFLAAGGKVERREFHAPGDLATLPEPVIINCPGYEARQLWRDESVVPVRGQIAWLIPQPEVTYGVWYKDVQVLSRTDGMVVQAVDGGDMKGYNDADETPDRREAEAAVLKVKELFGRFRGLPARG
jgi:glycine/D-amino acid oxidase-like deaminating enzyme